MGRVAKTKKNTENSELAVEKVNKKQSALKNDEISELNNEEQLNGEEVAVNGDAKLKTNSKSTKATKGKKESKVETKNPEAKVKATKNEKEAQEVQEIKKRVNKKKNEDENIAAGSKRSKKEPVSEDKNDEKIETAAENEENSEKRVRRKARKSPVIEIAEPSKKKAKKEKATIETAEKTKPVKGKKVAEKTKENDVPEKSVAKKVRGKSALRSEKPVEEIEKENDEPEKPVAKKVRGKSAIRSEKPVEEIGGGKEPKKAVTKTTKSRAKKGENQEKETTSPKAKASRKKPEENVPENNDVVDEPEDKVETKKGKAAKKDTKSAVKSPKTAKGRATKKDEKTADGKKKLLNSIDSDLTIDFDISSKWTQKIVMWNTSGLRSCVDKGCVDYFKRENADIICINEIKCGTEEEIPEQMKLEGYHAYWNIAKGYPGVGILTKQMPIEIFYDLPGEFSNEKRLITAEFRHYYLVCCYVVNAGRGLKTLDKRLEWNDVFDEYIKGLDKKKPVIIAGDMNVAHTEIDLANPKSNQKNAGFTKEEREGFTKLLDYGFVDTFRNFYPDQKGAYTFWSYMNNARSKNVGWRLDYFIASERFMDKVKDNVIRSTIKGSDHCPIVLFLDL